MKQRRQDQDFSHRCIDYACVLDFTMTTLSRQVFNHLVTMFTFIFRNSPETMIKGRIASQGHIEYFFRSFGAVTILFIEMKLVVDNDAERLKAIAQVIAECDGELHLTIQLTSSDFGLPVQVVTTKTVVSDIFYQSIVSCRMVCFLNSSSTRKLQTQAYSAAALKEIRGTSNAACMSRTSQS